jgi:hypothetical protein
LLDLLINAGKGQYLGSERRVRSHQPGAMLFPARNGQPGIDPVAQSCPHICSDRQQALDREIRQLAGFDTMFVYVPSRNGGKCSPIKLAGALPGDGEFSADRVEKSSAETAARLLAPAARRQSR